jgi:hypothetical protein
MNFATKSSLTRIFDLVHLVHCPPRLRTASGNRGSAYSRHGPTVRRRRSRPAKRTALPLATTLALEKNTPYASIAPGVAPTAGPNGLLPGLGWPWGAR